MPDLSQVVAYGPTVIILFLLLVFAVRMAPIYKELKLREFEVRDREAMARKEQSDSLAQLAIVIKDVAIEQQKTAESNEELRIFLKVAMREHEGLLKRVTTIESQIDVLKEGASGKVH